VTPADITPAEARLILAGSPDTRTERLARTVLALAEERDAAQDDARRSAAAAVDAARELGHVAAAAGARTGAAEAECARLRAKLARLRPMVADFEHGVDELAAERDRWRDSAERQARMLTREVTPQDAVEFFTRAILDEAAGAPNHAEWRGRYGARQWTVTVQWCDGQTPAQLIDAAHAERDAAIARCEALVTDAAALVTAVDTHLDGATDATRSTMRDARNGVVAHLLDGAAPVVGVRELAAAVRAERAAEASLTTASAELTRCVDGPPAPQVTACRAVDAAEATLADARRVVRVALDALLTMVPT
jgi:hypothetical protein